MSVSSANSILNSQIGSLAQNNVGQFPNPCNGSSAPNLMAGNPVASVSFGWKYHQIASANTKYPNPTSRFHRPASAESSPPPAAQNHNTKRPPGPQQPARHSVARVTPNKPLAVIWCGNQAR